MKNALPNASSALRAKPLRQRNRRLPLVTSPASLSPFFAKQGSKGYRAQALLGHETDTQDAEGEATVHGEWGHVRKETVDAALGQFVGDITQVPPMFSALHKDGKRLYELARQGITVRELIHTHTYTHVHGRGQKVSVVSAAMCR